LRGLFGGARGTKTLNGFEAEDRLAGGGADRRAAERSYDVRNALYPL